MKLVVANLTEEDMVAIAAYVASRPPVSSEAPAAVTPASRAAGSTTVAAVAQR